MINEIIALCFLGLAVVLSIGFLITRIILLNNSGKICEYNYKDSGKVR